MALIQYGSLDGFSAMAGESVRSAFPTVNGLHTLSCLREATRAIQPVPIDFEISGERRGFALKSLKLIRGFEGFLGNLFNATNEVYFLSWSWDFSGAPVVEYPGALANAAKCLIPLNVARIRQFLGSGIVLFPARKITSGLVTRIVLWESDQGVRDFGKTMSEVANTIKTSKLNNLLSLISLAAGVSDASILLIKDAAIELASAIGVILQTNSDDYVDFYEGYYPASDPWTRGDELHQGYASEIVLSRLV